MLKGTIYAIAACLIWGLIFVVPPYLKGFDSLEIALGRHCIYGITSCLLLLWASRNASIKYPLAIWGQAFLFSLIANIFYYSCVVMGVKHASPSITALILGVSPVLISFYGNWLQKECNFKSLIIPSVLILVGLFMVNIPIFQQEELGSQKPYYLIGVLASFGALFSWCWFVVANARFLKNNPEIDPQAWSTISGVTTLIWVLFLGGSYEIWQGAEHWQKFITPSPELWVFLGGCATLGILCSWIGYFLWNKASMLLPVSFAGQLTMFETIFGLLYFYLLKQESPPIVELAGITLMLSAILYGMKAFTEEQPALTTE